MRSEKRGLFWYDWWDICSLHQEYREGCQCCEAGYWEPRWRHRLGATFYAICPLGWRLWANRKNSPDLRQLEEWFPNLKKGRK